MLKSKKLDFLKQVHKHEVLDASKHVGLDGPQAETLWEKLCSHKTISPLFNLPNVIYSLGALIVCIAFTWFAVKNYSQYGASSLFFISLSYAVIFYGVGFYLWKVKKIELLGGLGIFLALALIPLTTYTFQDMVGWWPQKNPGDYANFYGWVQGGRFTMEIVTLALTLLSLYFIRFPLLTMILYLILWFMSMDVCPIILNISASQSSHELSQLRTLTSILFGVGTIAVAYAIDERKMHRFAFWGYFFGVFSFWGGMTDLCYDYGHKEEVFYFLYCFVNFVMIILAPILKRKIFLVLGIFGVLSYIGHLFHTYFSTSLAFPFALSLVGLGLIAITFALQRYKLKAPGVKSEALDSSVVD